METPPNERRLFSGALRLLSRRARSKKEIEDWLHKKRASEGEKNVIFQKLNNLKLIDDFEFAKSYARTRYGKSKREIILGLKLKGIDKTVALEALDEVGFDEGQVIKKLIQKNEWKWKNLSPKAKKQKIIEYLARKGFQIEAIQRVIGGGN